jgi:hypothetical protein
MSERPALFANPDVNGNRVLEQQEIVAALQRGGVNSLPLIGLLNLDQNMGSACAVRDRTQELRQQAEELLRQANPVERQEIQETLRLSQLLALFH